MNRRITNLLMTKAIKDKMLENEREGRHLGIQGHVKPVLKLFCPWGAATRPRRPRALDTSLNRCLSPLLSPEGENAAQRACRGVETRLFRIAALW